MKKNNQNNLKLAKRVALYGNVKRAKVSALAFSKSGTLISHAHNRRVYSKRKFTEHAEEVLLKKLLKLKAFERFGQISILVVRINKFGLAMAKPCRRCQRILSKHDVNVFYSNRDGEIQPLAA